MKKILSFLFVFSLSSASATTVVSCESKVKNQPSDTDIVNTIFNKIKNITLTLDKNMSNSTSNKQTIANIKLKLKMANHATNLNDTDLEYISFENKTLSENQENSIIATIRKNNTSKQIVLKINQPYSDATIVSNIKNKITNKNINLPAGTNTTVGNQNTTTLIKNQLKSNNNLSDTDLLSITLEDKNLNLENSNTVKITIKSGNAEDYVFLTITIPRTNQQVVTHIKSLISNKRITLPAGTDKDTTTPSTKNTLWNKLSTNNTRITNYKDNITFESKNLMFGDNTLKCTIKSDQTPSRGSSSYQEDIELNVTLPQTDTQAVDAIKNKIVNKDITIPATSNISTGNPQTITNIKNQLKQANNATNLNDTDLQYISLETKDLTLDSNTQVKATITINTASVDVNLNIRLNRTNQAIVDHINSLIQDKNITLPAGTNASTSESTTQTAIWNALINKNAGLSSYRSFVSFDNNKTLKFDQTNTLQGTISSNDSARGRGSASKIFTLNITLPRTNAQAVANIKDKIKDTNISITPGSNPSTLNNQTKTAIKNSLQTNNTDLTNTDLNKITFENKNLALDAQTIVIATITVGTGAAAASDTINLNITLQKDNSQIANDINNLLVDKNITIPAGTTANTSDSATKTAIWNELVADNSGLSSYRNNFIFNDTPLNIGSTTNVNGRIESDISGRGAIANIQFTLVVTLPASDAQKVATVKGKIINKTLTLAPGTNTSTGDSATITAIQDALVKANTGLSGTDIGMISIQNTTLTLDATTIVRLTITSGTASDTVDISINLKKTNQNVVNDILNNLTNTTITLDAGTNPDTSIQATKDAIWNKIIENNTNLSAGDKKYFEYETKTLKIGQADTLNGDIKSNESNRGAQGSVSFQLNITIIKTDKQIADEIKAKIKNTAVSIPPGSNTSTSITATATAIKTNLETLNTDLTTADLGKITLQSTTLILDQATTVTANISSRSYNTTIDLSVTLNKSNEQIVNEIDTALATRTITLPAGTDKNTNLQATKDAIWTELKAANSNLTDAYRSNFRFSNINLTVGGTSNLSGTISSKDSSRGNDNSKQFTISITLPATDRQKVDLLESKITDKEVTVDSLISLSTGVSSTTDAIWNKLLTENTQLQAGDKGNIQYNTMNLNINNINNLTAQVVYGSESKNFIIKVNVIPTVNQIGDAIRNQTLIIPNATQYVGQTLTSIKSVLNQAIVDAGFLNAVNADRLYWGPQTISIGTETYNMDIYDKDGTKVNAVANFSLKFES